MSRMNPVDNHLIALKLDKMLPKYACLTILGVTSGKRISELLSLKMGDLVSGGNIKHTVNMVVLKKGKPVKREIIIQPFALPYIEAHLRRQIGAGRWCADDYVFTRRGDNRPLSRHSAYQYYKRLFGSGHGTHWMRKTFARRIFDYYCQKYNDHILALEATGKALNHDRIENTVKYLNLEQEELGAVVYRIFKNIAEKKHETKRNSHHI